MNEVIRQPDFPFQEEALIMYTMLQLHLNKNSKEAWNMINESNIELAKELGFDVPTVEIITTHNYKAIAVERFDRKIITSSFCIIAEIN